MTIGEILIQKKITILILAAIIFFNLLEEH